MRWRRLGWLIVVGAAGLWRSPAVAASSAFDLAENRKGVVFIRLLDPDGLDVGSASGFVVSTDGLIYTNRHVVRPPGMVEQPQVLVGVPSAGDPDRLDYFRAAVAYVPDDAGMDVAILKIAMRPGYAAPRPLPLADKPPELGEAVAVVGYPLADEGPTLTFTRGAVSATRVRVGGATYWQTDATINHGNSGGPLLNEAGQVIGIATGRREVGGAPEGVGYALRMADVARAVATAGDLSRVRPEPGPLDMAALPHPAALSLAKGDWSPGRGDASNDDAGALVLDNHGDSYWVTGRTPLPKNFRLVVSGKVTAEPGKDYIEAVDGLVLGSMCVRFGNDDRSLPIDAKGGGDLFQISGAGLWFLKDGMPCAEKRGSRLGDDFDLAITRRDGHVTVGVPLAKPLVEADDAAPATGEVFRIGGCESSLRLTRVVLIDLDRPTTRPATAPPK